jgi:hypothetical protein
LDLPRRNWHAMVEQSVAVEAGIQPGHVMSAFPQHSGK